MVKNKKFFASKIFTYLMLFVMYAPILLLIVYSFTSSNQIGVWTGFSFKNYQTLFSSTNIKSKEIWEATGNTLKVAFASGIIATLLGTLGSIGMFYSKKRTRTVLDGVTQIPVINAEIVMAMSLTILIVALGCGFSFMTLVVGHVVLTIPFVVLSVTPKLKQMDNNLYEAALDLGATPSQALRRVVLPEIFPGVLSGFLLSLTLSLDDYIITAFTRPDGFETLSTYVEKVTKKAGLPNQLRALTTLIFVGILLAMIGYSIYNHRKGAKKQTIASKKGI